MNDTYYAWASVYDAIYSYVTEDIPFYVDNSLVVSGPVLELGCGTGRVTFPIARAGVEVVGLDSSPAMLDVARQKIKGIGSESKNVTLVDGDMRDFSFGRTFPLVIIPFRGFLSLLTVEDQTRTLLNVKRHLASGARFIFNIFVPDNEMLVQEGDIPYHFRDVTDPDTGNRYVLWHQSQYDNHSQVIGVRLIAEEIDPDGAMIQRFFRDFQLRYAYRWEMHHLLEKCGFEVIDVYGDFDRSPFAESSTEMIWVCGVP